MIGQTPAIVDRQEKTIYLNDDLWDKLDQDQQKAVLLHEHGHIVKDSPDEKLADEYAFEQFTRTAPASDFFTAFAGILDPDKNPEHQRRLIDIGLNAANNIHLDTGYDMPKKVIGKARRKFSQREQSLFKNVPDSFNGLTGQQRQDLYLEAIAMWKKNPSKGINEYYASLLDQHTKALEAANPFTPTRSYYVPDESGVYWESTTRDLTGAFREIGKAPTKTDKIILIMGALIGLVLLVFIVKKLRK